MTSRSCLSPRRRRTGYTLIELLLATTIAAMIGFALFAAMRVGFKARDAADAAITPGRNAEMVMEIIRTDLQSAELPPGGTFAQAFEGSPAQDDRGNDAADVLFYSTAPASVHSVNNTPIGNGEIKQIELTMYRPQGSNDYLLVRRTRNNLTAPTQENQDEEVLCRHVYGFTVNYFDGSTTSDTWDSTQQNNSLPVSVQIVLAIEAPEKNADGSPKITRFTRVFQIPCYGQQSQSSSSSTAGPTPAGEVRREASARSFV